jgi:hypothetical protein
MMEEAVEDGGGQDFVTEHLSPFAKSLVRGQDDRALFVIGTPPKWANAWR